MDFVDLNAGDCNSATGVPDLLVPVVRPNNLATPASAAAAVLTVEEDAEVNDIFADVSSGEMNEKSEGNGTVDELTITELMQLKLKLTVEENAEEIGVSAGEMKEKNENGTVNKPESPELPQLIGTEGKAWDEIVKNHVEVSVIRSKGFAHGVEDNEGSAPTISDEIAVEIKSKGVAVVETSVSAIRSPRTPDLVDDISTVADKSKDAHTFAFTGLNHVAFCVESLERSLEFYCGLLGLKTNMDRPELPYRGAWLNLGAEGIHIMEIPNIDPVHGRPNHGGFDRHACLNCKNVEGLRLTFEKAGIPYQPSMVPSIFARDPDGNGLEFIEVDEK